VQRRRREYDDNHHADLTTEEYRLVMRRQRELAEQQRDDPLLTGPSIFQPPPWKPTLAQATPQPEVDTRYTHDDGTSSGWDNQSGWNGWRSWAGWSAWGADSQPHWGHDDTSANYTGQVDQYNNNRPTPGASSSSGRKGKGIDHQVKGKGVDGQAKGKRR